jgi:hypothetical protein
MEEIGAFFGLGHSMKKGGETELYAGSDEVIGEKGHGTKVYFNSKRVEVRTSRDGQKFVATLDRPLAVMTRGGTLEAEVDGPTPGTPGEHGTQIIVYGYNKNDVALFGHARLRDHVLWFTKFGSCEKELGIVKHASVKLYLKGLDRPEPEELTFGHNFPPEASDVRKLERQYEGEQVASHYCRRFTFSGHLPNNPDIDYQAVISVEGNKVKYKNNPMVRRPGYKAPSGAYKVAERYGIWLCKDFIPVEQRNEPITYKGSEFTRLHGFFNCQGFRLSANRGTVAPTEGKIKDDVDRVLKELYDEIFDDNKVDDLFDELDEIADVKRKLRKEREEYEKRKLRADSADVAEYKGVILVEPTSEIGVLSMMVQLSVIEPDLFPFTILDYDMKSGYDVLAGNTSMNSVNAVEKYFVEYKNELTQPLNHSFQNLMSIVCWKTKIKHDGGVEDLTGERRIMKITPPARPGSYTAFALTSDRPGMINIEVFVLKEYLREKLGVEFHPRRNDARR